VWHSFAAMKRGRFGRLSKELQNAPVAPLLPIEKKVIGWSFGVGLVLLVILVLVNYFVPVTVTGWR